MEVELYANTNGKGHWSSERKEVLVNKIVITEVQEYDDDPNDNAVYMEVYFDRSTWKIDRDGLIYTDPRFIRELRRGLRELGLAGRIANKVDYTEQGAQGTNYVHVAACGLRRKDMLALIEFMEADPGRLLAETFYVRKGRRVLLQSGDWDKAFAAFVDNIDPDEVDRDKAALLADKGVKSIGRFELFGISIANN